MDSRLERFHKLLSQTTVNLDHLRALAWNGIPTELRPTCWRLLLVCPLHCPLHCVCCSQPHQPCSSEGVQGGQGRAKEVLSIRRDEYNGPATRVPPQQHHRITKRHACAGSPHCPPA
jgi:hypothetical protein